MRLNYELLKEILIFIEENADGDSIFILRADALEKYFPNYPWEETKYHFAILGDDSLIYNCVSVGQGVKFKRLTAEGHRVLESMKNETLWNKIKSGAITLGIEGIKQIPSLAIKMLLR